jgi:nucleotide-binding universal stress UspA family protein
MPALYRTIVVGTDGSDSANEALRHAGELGKVSGTEKIHVVMASRRIERAEVRMAMEDIPEDLDAHPDLHAGDKYVLAKADEMLEPYGIAVETHLIADGPADAIIDLAEQVGADLIVVGNRGHGAGKRLFLGSVSTKVVQHAHEICAVLVVSCGD